MAKSYNERFDFFTHAIEEGVPKAVGSGILIQFQNLPQCTKWVYLVHLKNIYMGQDSPQNFNYSIF